MWLGDRSFRSSAELLLGMSICKTPVGYGCSSSGRRQAAHRASLGAGPARGGVTRRFNSIPVSKRACVPVIDSLGKFLYRIH